MRFNDVSQLQAISIPDDEYGFPDPVPEFGPDPGNEPLCYEAVLVQGRFGRQQIQSASGGFKSSCGGLGRHPRTLLVYKKPGILHPSKDVLNQGWGTPGITGRCPLGFRCVLDPTQLV